MAESPAAGQIRQPPTQTKGESLHWLFPAFLVVCAAMANLLFIAFQPVVPDGESYGRAVAIPQGMTAGAIAAYLADEGLIRSPLLLSSFLRLTADDTDLMAGEYFLSPAMPALEILDQLRQGNVVTYRVMIPEGYEAEQIAAALERRGLVDQERFLALVFDGSLVYGGACPLDLPIASLEGYLFPDTYHFTAVQSEEDIIRQMVARFLDVVPSAVEPYLGRHGFDLHDIVTLASIVEREVMVDRERPIVAGVYLNRLEINMRLQADPTVRYVMTENRSRVLYRDLEIDSPYNTYRYGGLPPGPIASPGLRSIMAVLYPADVEYFFFVARGDGTHVFTRTFEEHVQARQRLGY